MKSIALLFCLFSACLGHSQQVTPMSLGELKAEMAKESDELRVYNFWASWCGPCIKEMPYFDELSKETNVTLISLDFKEDLNKAENLLIKKNISLSSYLLTEGDMDKYAPVISDSWTGAIPATVIIASTGDRYFFERSFEKDELFELVESIK